MSSSLNNSISCFNHCSKLVFYKSFPENCPVCNEKLLDFITQPFQLPFPFTNPNETSVSIIVRPSSGTFLDNYEINKDLHIGIVDSNHNIFEFDKFGVVKNAFSFWNNCININIVPESWFDHWDTVLINTASDPIWNSDNYNDIAFNCYDFVITFLNNLNYQNIQFSNKEDICEKFILPKMREVMRYITVSRKLIDSDFYVQN